MDNLASSVKNMGMSGTEVKSRKGKTGIVSPGEPVASNLRTSKVRQILSDFGFEGSQIDTWDSDIHVPLGATVETYVAETAILEGLSLSEPDLYPELQFACLVAGISHGGAQP